MQFVAQLVPLKWWRSSSLIYFKSLHVFLCSFRLVSISLELQVGQKGWQVGERVSHQLREATKSTPAIQTPSRPTFNFAAKQSRRNWLKSAPAANQWHVARGELAEISSYFEPQDLLKGVINHAFCIFLFWLRYRKTGANKSYIFTQVHAYIYAALSCNVTSHNPWKPPDFQEAPCLYSQNENSDWCEKPWGSGKVDLFR